MRQVDNEIDWRKKQGKLKNDLRWNNRRIKANALDCLQGPYLYDAPAKCHSKCGSSLLPYDSMLPNNVPLILVELKLDYWGYILRCGTSLANSELRLGTRVQALTTLVTHKRPSLDCSASVHEISL